MTHYWIIELIILASYLLIGSIIGLVAIRRGWEKEQPPLLMMIASVFLWGPGILMFTIVISCVTMNKMLGKLRPNHDRQPRRPHGIMPGGSGIEFPGGSTVVVMKKVVDDPKGKREIETPKTPGKHSTIVGEHESADK